MRRWRYDTCHAPRLLLPLSRRLCLRRALMRAMLICCLLMLPPMLLATGHATPDADDVVADAASRRGADAMLMMPLLLTLLAAYVTNIITAFARRRLPMLDAAHAIRRAADDRLRRHYRA